MRSRLLTLLPSALALTLVSLLVAPLAVLAQSGAATISMYPETAGPGSTVEVTGVGFPPARLVEVQLTTPDGAIPLTTATTSAEGGFRQIVALPIAAPDGVWQLQATSSDGVTSTYGFITSPDAADVVAASAATNAVATSAGNTGGDIALMLIVAVVLAGAAFGAMIFYRQVKDESPPGMGRGDDLIWGRGVADGNPEQTATEEPHWKDAQASHNES